MARPRVLVVDDDRDIRESLSEILDVEGFDVETAVNGSEALERLESPDGFDILVTDLMMPVMDGWALVAELRARPRFRRMPIAVITAHSNAVVPGADRVVTKPFDIDELVGAVREASEHRPRRPSAARAPEDRRAAALRS